MCSTSSNYPIHFKLLELYTVNIKHPPTWRTIYKRLQAGDTKNTMWLLPRANKSTRSPFLGGDDLSFQTGEYPETPEEAGLSPSTMLFLLAGRSLKDSRLHHPHTNQTHLFPHTSRQNWILTLRRGHGHPQHWSSRDVFYFKKTQQEIHRLWTPGYFQAVWGRDCQIQWTTGTVVSQGHCRYCSLRDYP